MDRDIESSSKRWKKLVECECPEREKFPQEWKNKTALQRLCMLRALRPDRMTYAISTFIEEKLGVRYVEGRTVEFAKSYEETSPSTPIFFILSPGVNPLKVKRKMMELFQIFIQIPVNALTSGTENNANSICSALYFPEIFFLKNVLIFKKLFWSSNVIKNAKY